MRASWGATGSFIVWLLVALIAGCGDPENKLVSIEVTLETPRVASLLATRTQQANATGTFSDGSTLDLTDQVQWSSSNTGVATVNGVGLVTGVAVGTTTIGATYQQFMDEVQVTVDPPILVSLDITAPSASVPDGLFLQLTATGTFSDGTTNDITDDVAWSSNNTGVATVDPLGEVEGITTGGAVITATMATISDTFALTVSGGVLTSITVTPDNDSQPKGRVVQYTATGNFSDGVTNDVTAQATWSVDLPAIATVNNTTNKGRVTMVATGSATITAVMGGFTDTTQITVDDAVVDSIVVTPAAPAPLPLGVDLQFTCTATLSDGSTDDCTDDCAWTSSLPGVASVDGAGLVTANNTTLGTTNIACDFLTFDDDVDVVVTNAVLESITVTPDDLDIPVGLPIDYTATGHFSNGTNLDITSTATWTATPPSFLTITPGGIATSQPGTTAGPCTVIATMGTINDVASCDLTAGILTSIDLTPDNFSLPIGLTQQYTATGNFSDGNAYNVTPLATWTSTFPAIASISNAEGSVGQATALTAGSTTIGATFGSINRTTTLTVDPPPAPEIQFLLAGSPFGSGGTNNLGSALAVGVAVPFTLTIQNLGTANLTLGTSTFTTQTGCTGAFTTPAPASPLAPNATTTISGTVTPTAAGGFTCTFSTPNNDTTGGENPYVIQLTGTTGAPSIVVEDALGPLTLGGVHPVGQQLAGVPFTVPITIRNPGTATLNIIGTSIDTASSCTGAITTQPASSVAAGGFTTLIAQLTCNAGTGQPFAAKLFIDSDAPGVNQFFFFAYGVETAPLGNFGPTDGVWTGNGGCGLNQVDLDTGPTILSPNFPGNAGTVFTLTGPNTASAGPNLFIFGAPFHTCVITLLSGTQIRINCTNTSGGSCLELFSPAPQPEIHVRNQQGGEEILNGVAVFGGEFAGLDQRFDLLVDNHGSATLNIGAIAAGVGSSCTIKQISTFYNPTLAPGDTTSVFFTFDAPIYPWGCKLLIPSNDPNEPVFTVNLRGGQPPF